MSRTSNFSIKNTGLVFGACIFTAICIVSVTSGYSYINHFKVSLLSSALMQNRMLATEIDYRWKNIHAELKRIAEFSSQHDVADMSDNVFSSQTLRYLHHQTSISALILVSSDGTVVDGRRKDKHGISKIDFSNDIAVNWIKGSKKGQSNSDDADPVKGYKSFVQLNPQNQPVLMSVWPVYHQQHLRAVLWAEIKLSPLSQIADHSLRVDSLTYLVVNNQFINLISGNDSVNSPLIKDLLPGDKGYLEKLADFNKPVFSHFSGEEVFVIKQSIPGIDGRLVTEVPCSWLYTHIWKLMVWPALGVLIVVLLSLYLINRVSRYFFRPLDYLSAGLKKAAQGDFNKLDNTPVFKELAEPFLSFNEMVEQRRLVHQSIKEIVSEFSTKKDMALMTGMLNSIADLFKADYAFVGLVDQQDNSKVNTLAVMHDHQLMDNFTYSLGGTPCSEVKNSGTCVFPQHIQEMFPEDILLQQMEIQGYIGVPVYNRNNDFIGLLVLLTCHSFSGIKQVNDLLMLYSLRISAELESMSVRKSLDDAQQRLILFKEKSQLAIIEFTAEGLVQEWNPAAENLFGYDRKEVVGKDAVEVLVPKTQHAPVRQLFQQLNNNSGGGYSIIQNLTRDGNVISCQWHNTALTNNKGEVAAIVSIVENISARLASEKARKVLREQLESEVARRTRALKQETEQNKKLILAIEQSTSSVCITDINREIEYVNPTFTRLTGYSLVEVLGKKTHFLIAEQQSSEQYEDIWHVVEQGQFWQGELIKQSKSGCAFWVNTSITPLFSSPDTISHYVIVEENITEQKRLARELQTKVDEQTKARHTMMEIMRDLDSAKIEAEQATEAKSRFLANMSHEIRTPMNAIIGINHLLQQTKLNTHQQTYLKKIHQAASSLLAIINDVLDFSKIEAGKIEIEITDFQLDMLLSSVAEMAALPAQDKGIEFIIDVEHNVPQSVQGDMHRLQQVLLNFCSNAAKFTARGEIVLKTELLNQTEKEVRLRFSVTDTGIGINETVLQRLVSPFTQADPSTTREFGGTGLGLVISKRLIELMGGEFYVSSREGEGSEFGFTIKLGRFPEISANDEINLVGVKILLLDDNASFLAHTRRILLAHGCEVETAQSSDEALHKLNLVEHSAVDLLLIDWDEQAEHDLCKIIAATYIQPDNVIALLSSYRQDQLIDQVDHIGLEGLLVKPITASELTNAVRSKMSMGSRVVSVQESQHAKTSFQGINILLVEDNMVNQLVAVDLLEQTGGHVVVADNGIQALEKMSEQVFDLVIMDIQMPGMDGYQATREIRKNPSWTDVPIIAMSANVLPEDVNRCMDVGMNDYLSKPVVPEKLYAMINKWL